MQCKESSLYNLNGILANSADLNQTPQNVTSDQVLHCLLKLQKVQG